MLDSSDLVQEKTDVKQFSFWPQACVTSQNQLKPVDCVSIGFLRDTRASLYSISGHWLF